MKVIAALVFFLAIFLGSTIGPWILLGPDGFWQKLACGIVCGITGIIGFFIGAVVAVAIADED